jgi:O-antigen/teichoic acid export membrane protein
MKRLAKAFSSQLRSIVYEIAPSHRQQSRLLSGSFILLSASVLVGVMNLLYNLVVAHMLGPEGFSHATVVYTLLVVSSAVTLSVQVVCAKMVASHETQEEKAAIYSGLHWKAWKLAVVVSVCLILAKGLIAKYLNLPDTRLIILLALGTAFYIPLGARRGAIQGTYSFRVFGINLMLEAFVRLLGAWVLIRLGMGAAGAVLAGALGVMVAYFFAFTGLKREPGNKLQITAHFREGVQANTFFIGMVIINNFDIVLAKHFFPAEEAGLYAAVGLVGRVIIICAWSVVNAMFPMSAGEKSKGRQGNSILLTSLAMVLGILGLLFLTIWLTPSTFWDAAFGKSFQMTGYGSLQGLMILYAVSTGIYALSVVVISYEMSRKIANTAWVQLAFSGALVFGIYMFHDSLRQMIWVQVVLMTILLAIVAVPILWSSFMSDAPSSLQEARGNIRRLRPITEQEAVAEFLKNEIYHEEFDPYRSKIERLVNTPNLENADENSLRKALLYLRRGAMWRELPDDTKWFEVEMATADLAGVRVFPRAQWRRVSQGSFGLYDVVQEIRRSSAEEPDDEFFSKLRRLSNDESVNRTVLLIGLNDSEPVTILDGNHRIAAAMLVAPETVLKRFRFLCGFSPRMNECCWYETNMTTLWRYAKNRMRYMPYDPEVDIGRLLEDAS